MDLPLACQVISLIMISSHLNHLSLTKLVRKIFSIKYCILFVYTGLEENVSCCGIAERLGTAIIKNLYLYAFLKMKKIEK